MKNKTILLADAAFLGGLGGIMMIQDFLGHFFQQGYFAEQFTNSPYTIGFFEASGLALLFAISFVININSSNRRFWHGIAAVIHILLGGSNLLFWQNFFVTFGFVTQGIGATVLHGVFILANLYAFRKEHISLSAKP